MIKITNTLESFLNLRTFQQNSPENTLRIFNTLSVFNEFTQKKDDLASQDSKPQNIEKPQNNIAPKKLKSNKTETNSKAIGINISKKNRRLISYQGIVK